MALPMARPGGAALFKVSPIPNDVRVIEPSLQYPFGEEPVVIDPQGNRR